MSYTGETPQRYDSERPPGTPPRAHPSTTASEAPSQAPLDPVTPTIFHHAYFNHQRLRSGASCMEPLGGQVPLGTPLIVQDGAGYRQGLGSRDGPVPIEVVFTGDSPNRCAGVRRGTPHQPPGQDPPPHGPQGHLKKSPSQSSPRKFLLAAASSIRMLVAPMGMTSIWLYPGGVGQGNVGDTQAKEEAASKDAQSPESNWGRARKAQTGSGCLGKDILEEKEFHKGQKPQTGRQDCGLAHKDGKLGTDKDHRREDKWCL